jgi:hypothetical protein
MPRGGLPADLPGSRGIALPHEPVFESAGMLAYRILRLHSFSIALRLPLRRLRWLAYLFHFRRFYALAGSIVLANWSGLVFVREV